jgi:TPR repeat protein
MAAQIFISYAREDRERAEHLASRLTAAGWSVWWDRHIRGGSNFQKVTEDAIATAKLVIVLWSRASVQSDWVLAEAGWALDEQKILPVRIDAARLPLRFIHVQTIDLADWDGGDAAPGLTHLLDEVAHHLGQEASKAPPVEASAAASTSPPREPPGGGGGLLLPWPDGVAAHEFAEQGRPAPFAARPRGQPGKVADVAGPAAPATQPAVVPSPSAFPRSSETTRAPAAAQHYRNAAIGLAMLGGSGIGAAAWYWSGSFWAKPAPVPAAIVAPDGLSNGKAAFERGDYVEAMRWDRQAADQGNTTAQTYVGYLYEKGLGVPHDYSEALRWYRKAADQGYAPGQKNIGNLYEQGLGVKQDYGEAMRWYRLAADQGNARAQTNIGYLYEGGLGVPQSYSEALYWYRKAAAQGEAVAQNNIGVFYDKGYGVPQNLDEAKRWYLMAAEKGNIDSQYNLALLLSSEGDRAQARQWMQKAAAAGDPGAKQWLVAHGE